MEQFGAQALAFLANNWMSLLALCALVVLFVLVIGSIRRREAALARRLEDMEEDMDESLERTRLLSEEQSQRELELIQSSFLNFNTAIVRMIGEMARTQQGQLDSFGGQIREAGKVDGERMDKMRLTVEQRLGSYEQRMDKVTATLEEGLTRMQAQNQQKLEEMRVTVDEKLHATLDRRLGESFQLVSERLDAVSKGLGEMQTLASGVGDLKKVLTNVKTRGTWGEVQLGALLEQVLAPSQFRANVAVVPGSGERVEYAIVLPGRGDDAEHEVYLPIDAKFPSEDYQRLVAASEKGDAAEVETASKAFDNAVRTQAKRIHDKYVQPPHTTDYAILFLPTEGLYAEVLRGSLAEEIQRQFRVIITGPTTLAALLNSLQMGFRTLAIEQRSSEVWALLSAVKTEFGRFADLLSKTQQKLRQASDSIEDAARKTRTIQRRLRDVSEMPERGAAISLLTEGKAGDALEEWEAAAAEDMGNQ